MNEYTAFAKRLKKALKAKGMSQRQLALKIGVVPPAICYYCSGKTQPRVSILRDICKCLGVSADYMIGLKDEEGPYTD